MAAREDSTPRSQINGTEVHVCQQLSDDPTAGRQPNRPLWLFCGAVADESDAQEWCKETDHERRYKTVTVGKVEAPY